MAQNGKVCQERRQNNSSYYGLSSEEKDNYDEKENINVDI